MLALAAATDRISPCFSQEMGEVEVSPDMLFCVGGRRAHQLDTLWGLGP